MQSLTDLFVGAQGWLFDSLVQPLLFGLGLGSFVEMGFEGIEFVLLGLVELAIAYTLMRPLEAWWPAEKWAQRRAVRVDVIYTVLNRLGIVPLVVFALLAPLFLGVDGWLRFHDIIP
ncbi:MAG: fatty acid hydroxylase, partial [Zoogloea sp.]|nr:fatty acid hydroxylase [Zoogloea sp.]